VGPSSSWHQYPPQLWYTFPGSRVRQRSGLPARSNPGRLSSVDAELVKECRVDPADNLFSYTSEDIHKQTSVPFSQFKGNVTLVVNVASF